MAEIDIEEAVAIKKFRSSLEDVLHDEYTKSDYYLIRWLRARDLNLEKSEKMLRDSLKWRDENKVDSLLELHLPEFFTSNFPYNVDFHDKDGRAFFMIPIGRWDVRLAVDENRYTEFVQYTNQMFENVIAAIKKGKSNNPKCPHTQCSMIADWDGFSFRQLVNIKAAQGILQMAMTYEAHYPEILHTGLMINCTYAFSIFFKLLKPILAPKTMAKLHIFGTNRDDWVPTALENFNSDQLPKHYGGENNVKLSWVKEK